MLPDWSLCPEGEDEGRESLEAEAGFAPENKDKFDCDLFPNSTTEPTRARRMR